MRLRTAALCPTALLLLLTPLFAANLVFDSSFESAVGAGTVAEGWDSMGAPPGGENSVSDARAHSGRFSHRLVVPDAAPVNWYQVRQSVPNLRPGQTVTLSVYISAENVRDGAGAYCSLNCFAGNDRRVGVFDAEQKVTGTTAGWVRQTVTATISPGTNEVVIILTLHGHGTAWFDDVQLEQGASVSGYQVSAVDLEAAELAKTQRQEAEKLAATLTLGAGKLGQVAILKDTLPADGCPSSPDRIAQWLRQAGYAVCTVSAAQLANPFLLRGPLTGASEGPLPAFDLLVLPYGGAFPAGAAKSLQNYLRQGGAFLSTGGYALDTLLVQHQGRWYKPQDLPLPEGNSVSLVSATDADPAGWGLGCDTGGNKPTLKTVAGRTAGTTALEFAVTPLRYWATATRVVEDRLPAPEATGGRQWSVTRFWARGDANTPKMAFEWDEADGSRWKVNLPLTTAWKEYVLTPGDFTYWHDNPSVGRGGPGDRFHPERARALQLGLALDIVERDQPHSFQIADLRVQADPLGDLREPARCLNTRLARIRDAMWPTPDQIAVFDPANRLEFVTGGRPAPTQFVATGASWQGAFSGYSAVAMTSNQGHGFGPNLSRWVPLLEATDRFGRNRGALGAILYNYDGFYRGSAWAFFGVTNKDLFGPDYPQAKTLLLSTVAALQRRVYLHDTDTEFSSYAPGETVRFRTRVSNYGQQAAKVTVSLAATPEGAKQPLSLEKPVTLAPGATEDVSFEWPAPKTGADGLCRFACTVLADGKPLDREANAVFLGKERSAAKLAALGRRGPYFTLGDRPLFLLGSQTYWGQNGSVTARSPLAFDRDFALMQDYGMHFSRLFVPFKTDSDRRQSDAMVQLAQRHRIVFYHAPNLGNTADPRVLAEETTTSRELGERYRGTPWFAVDVCNEPSLRVEDETLTGPFNEYLRQQYGTTAALRAAWKDDTVELAQVKLQPLSDRWDDLRAYDTHRFLAQVQQRWAEANRAAVRAADPTRLVSVGLMQGFGSGSQVWDPPLCDANLDFSDRHYYGPPSGQPTQLKTIDQRLLGQPLIQGECGAKDHPTFASADPWGMGDDDVRYNHRFEYLVHHAFALGGAALSSWHWRDPMEGIFPCGQVRSDRVPRPSAAVMRALGFTFGRLRPAYATPQVALVVPETHRLGGSRNAVNGALSRAIDVLLSCQVDFGVLSEARLGQLPAGVKTLLYPVPYCPPDAVVGQLQAFVQKGGVLYFSGDIGYDPNRQLTRAQRLVDLAGVERTGVKDPNVAPCRTPITYRLQGGAALPGEAPAVVNKLGQGQVIFCPAPAEAAPEQPAWQRSLYLEVLRRAGVERNPVTPDRPTLECECVPLEGGGKAFVLYNAGEALVKATVAGGIVLDLAPASSGLVVLDGQGRLTAVETQGQVTRQGRPLLQATGHLIVQSLDGKDLAASRQLVLLPFPGHDAQPPVAGKRASLTCGRLSGMRVELGELQGTRWTRLEALATDKSGRLGYDGEQALQMILAATPQEFTVASQAVESFTREP